MFVDEEFVRRLETGEVRREKLLAEILPGRPWHEEKLNTFLSKLSDQSKQKESV